jgi:hypothetical protein
MHACDRVKSITEILLQVVSTMSAVSQGWQRSRLARADFSAAEIAAMIAT